MGVVALAVVRTRPAPSSLGGASLCVVERKLRDAGAHVTAALASLRTASCMSRITPVSACQGLGLCAPYVLHGNSAHSTSPSTPVACAAVAVCTRLFNSGAGRECCPPWS